MIGYSLSFCVKDVINGDVDLRDVEKIFTGTCLHTENDWTKCIDAYCAVYWHVNPLLARHIVQQLRESNRIEQPRLTNPDYERYIGKAYWEE